MVLYFISDYFVKIRLAHELQKIKNSSGLSKTYLIPPYFESGVNWSRGGSSGVPWCQRPTPFLSYDAHPCISSNGSIQDGCPSTSHHILIPASRRKGGRDRHISTFQGHFLEVAFHWSKLSQMAIPGCKGRWKSCSHSGWPKIQGFVLFFVCFGLVFLRKEQKQILGSQQSL